MKTKEIIHMGNDNRCNTCFNMGKEDVYKRIDVFFKDNFYLNSKGEVIWNWIEDCEDFPIDNNLRKRAIKALKDKKKEEELSK